MNHLMTQNDTNNLLKAYALRVENGDLFKYYFSLMAI